MILQSGEASLVAAKSYSIPWFRHHCKTLLCESVDEVLVGRQNFIQAPGSRLFSLCFALSKTQQKQHND